MDDRPGSGFAPRDHAWHPRARDPAYKSSVLRSPGRPLVALASTLSETTGPVFGHDMIGAHDNDLLINFARPGETAIGERLIVHGSVRDEDGRPVPGILVEVWQANAGGRYRHQKESYVAALDDNFAGCGRTITADDGSYSFRTVRPGAYPWPNGPNDWRPSHIHFSLLGSGFAQRLVTQMYFEGDPLIARCPIVNTIPSPEAVAQLVARYDPGTTVPMDARAYRFDIVLRGRRSTPFENRMEGN